MSSSKNVSAARSTSPGPSRSSSNGTTGLENNIVMESILKATMEATDSTDPGFKRELTEDFLDNLHEDGNSTVWIPKMKDVFMARCLKIEENRSQPLRTYVDPAKEDYEKFLKMKEMERQGVEANAQTRRKFQEKCEAYKAAVQELPTHVALTPRKQDVNLNNQNNEFGGIALSLLTELADQNSLLEEEIIAVTANDN